MPASKPQKNPYQVSLSLQFLVLSVLAAGLTCFSLGSLARWVLLMQQQNGQASLAQVVKDISQTSLPPLFVAPHKSVPRTRYTSKHYDTGLSVSSDTLLSSRQRQPSEGLPVAVGTAVLSNATTEEDGEEEVHEPAGQHLLVDIEHVDGAFLNSEHHLAQAMIDLVDQSGLTMLSYHCHKLLPAGVSCAGVLLESHVSFHTWPVQRVITLDLFTCGPNSLLNLLGDVDTLFAIPDSTTLQTPNHKDPNMVWAWKRRGFPTDEGYTPGISDLGTTLLGVLQFPQKEQLSFQQTPFQSVHIYNVLDPRYSLAKMDRRMYLDGVLQSRERGQAANAEALVHPALLAHASPHKVTIVGGGDGASLREVLKHASVEQVAWAEIDQAVVEISQEWLWSQCHDFLPTVLHCREDPRVNLSYEDGFQWFQKRYGVVNDGGDKDDTDSKATRETAPLQDVIILDVLNPEDEVDFSEVFFDDLGFAQVLHDALETDGILAVPLGAGRSINDPPEQWTRVKHVARLVRNLEQVGFAAIHEYEDSHTGKLEIDTNSFLVAFKDESTRQEWFANEAQIEVKLQERMMRTKTGELPLRYFDGAIMQSYQMPSRASEVMFCKNENVDCKHGLDPKVENVPLGKLGASEIGQAVAKQDIRQGSLVGMETCVHELDVEATALLVSKESIGKVGLTTPANAAGGVTDIYNPFQNRNAFTRACTSKSVIHTDVAAGEIIPNGRAAPSKDDEMQTATTISQKQDEPKEAESHSNTRVHESNNVDSDADTHLPNLTTASSSEGSCSENLSTNEGECMAA